MRPMRCMRWWRGWDTRPRPSPEMVGSRCWGRSMRKPVRRSSAGRSGESMRPGPMRMSMCVAHSYGTTTSSIALTQSGTQVDSFVSLGSAGLPPNIDRASDLNAAEVFAGQARDVVAIDPAGGDQWAWTGRLSPEHPVNPIEDDFGAHAFGTDGGATGARVTDHSPLTPTGNGYLDRGTESLENVAFATTGQGDQASAYVPPEPTPFQEAILDGATHGHG